MKQIGQFYNIYRCSNNKVIEEALVKYYKKNDPLSGFCN